MANAQHVALSSTLPPADLVAARLHDGEILANKNAGKFSVRLPSGEETMLPYAELSDAARADIRGRVDQVYAAIDLAADDAKTETKTRKAG